MFIGLEEYQIAIICMKTVLLQKSMLMLVNISLLNMALLLYVWQNITKPSFSIATLIAAKEA